MNPPVIAGITQEMEAILRPIARYTRFVRSIKVVLALFAALLIGAILFYAIYEKDASGMRVAFTSITKKTPSSPTQMLGAKFHGLDKDNQPYNLNATTATQLDDDTLGLDHPTGDISLKSGAWLSVSGNEGIFKMKEKELDLKGSIEMFNDGGYEFRTDVMHVNVGAKTAVTHDEVKGQGPLGTLDAHGGATVDGNSSVINFMGPVFVTIYPAHDDGTKKPQSTEQ